MLAFASEVHCKAQGVLRHARQYLPGNGTVTTAAAAARAPQQLELADHHHHHQQQHERVRLAVVGDVHGQWGPADVAALKALRADAVLWVGECTAAIQPAGLRSTSPKYTPNPRPPAQGTSATRMWAWCSRLPRW